jgi:hypothetical protein
MQISNERKQHNETTRNETRNSREDKEKQRGRDIDNSDNQSAVKDESRNTEEDTTDSGNRSPVSLRRRSKYFRNDTL